MAKFVGARAYNSGAITLTHNIVTALTFDSERFDTDTIHSTASNTGRLTATTAGKYVIVGHVNFDTNATGQRLLQIRLNGATVIASMQQDATAALQAAMSIATIYDLAATDYVELLVRQNSGGNLDITATSNLSPEFAMHRVG